jgi:hypothetical protein
MVQSLKLIAGGAGVLVLLGGCGNDFAGGSIEDITEATSKDMKELDSLRLKGDVTTEGQQVSMDMQMTTDGDCQGSISLMGGKAEFLSVGGDTWFRPDEDFWRATAADRADQIIGLVGDKWVVLPPDEADVSSFCDLDELLKEFDDDQPDEDTKKGETDEVRDEETIIVEGKSDEGDPTKAWIAVDGEHYILKLEVDQGDEPGVIELSDFNEDLDLEAPSDDDVIDLNQASG